MKKFYILLVVFDLIYCILLYRYFNYKIHIVVFHFIAFLFFLALNFFINFIFINYLNRKYLSPVLFWINLCFHTFFFLFIFVTSISNFFWHKTISLQIIKNYIASFADFISILPIEKSIIYIFIIFYIALVLIFYIFFRPRIHKFELFQSYKKKGTILFALLSLIIIIFFSKLIYFKRYLQFNEEPLLQFSFGNLWGQGNEVVFDEQNYRLGLKDSTCIRLIQYKDTLPEKTYLIILIDGLRQDHLPMYGYQRNTSPFLDSLYRQNELMVVKNSFSPANNTIGGVASLFYSRDWSDFGYNGLNLMKFMQRQQYKTYAFLTGYHRDWYGLSSLYRSSCDYYYESATNMTSSGDDDFITLNKMKNSDFEKKSFIYMHLLSTHIIGKRYNEYKKYFPDKLSLNSNKSEVLINNYDNGILQADIICRNVFDWLKEKKSLDKTTIFIVADHGDLFGEDGRYSHGNDLNEYLMGVPIMIFDKNKNWYKNLQNASLLDVAPTIADNATNFFPSCWQGSSLHNFYSNDYQLKLFSIDKCDYNKGLLNIKDSMVKVSFYSKTDTISKIKINGTWLKN